MSNKPNINRVKNIKEKRKKERRKSRNRILLLIFLGLAILVMTVLIIFIWIRPGINKTSNSTEGAHVHGVSLNYVAPGEGIIGMWRYDEDSAFSFDEDGKGEYLFHENKYSYSYKLNGDILSIDFEDEKVRDISYKFMLADGDKKAVITVINSNGDVTEEVYNWTKE